MFQRALLPEEGFTQVVAAQDGQTMSNLMALKSTSAHFSVEGAGGQTASGNDQAPDC